MTHACISKLAIIGQHNGFFAWSAQGHYLYQCWNIVNSNLRNKIQWNLKQNSNILIQENAFENIVCKMVAILSNKQIVSTWILDTDSVLKLIRIIELCIPIAI